MAKLHVQSMQANGLHRSDIYSQSKFKGQYSEILREMLPSIAHCMSSEEKTSRCYLEML